MRYHRADKGRNIARYRFFSGRYIWYLGIYYCQQEPEQKYRPASVFKYHASPVNTAFRLRITKPLLHIEVDKNTTYQYRRTIYNEICELHFCRKRPCSKKQERN